MFKQLTHISLQMRPGNDNAIKSYLSTRLEMTLVLSQQQRNDIEQLRKENLLERRLNSEISQELKELT